MKQALQTLLRRYPPLRACIADIQSAYTVLENTYYSGGKLLLCGNGGSAADAEHIAGELMKGFLLPRPIPEGERMRLREMGSGDIGALLQGALPAVALTGHIALSSAVMNDIGGDMAFAQQLYGLGVRGDVLWGLSTSGNSTNVIHAFHVAKLRGVKTVACTGRDGGALAGIAEVCIRVPGDSVVEIQELHLPVYHALCAMLEEEFFKEKNQ